jgi:hypothetical protein
MFFPLWIVIPVAVLVVLFVAYVVTVALLMVFAKYFVRSTAGGTETVDKPIRVGQSANFERAYQRSGGARDENTSGAG